MVLYFVNLVGVVWHVELGRGGGGGGDGGDGGEGEDWGDMFG